MDHSIEKLREYYPLWDEYFPKMSELNLTDPDFDGVRSECANLNLSEEGFDVVFTVCLKLADFSKNGISEVKTEKQTLDSFDEIIKTSKKLHELLELLSVGECIRFDLAVFDFENQGDTKEPCLIDRYFQALHSVAIIGNAANSVLTKMRAEGADGKGRRKTQGKYAGYVAELACRLKRFGVVPGDGGPFRRLCDEVWKVAKVPAEPKGAIAYFNKQMRADYQHRGYCL